MSESLPPEASSPSETTPIGLPNDPLTPAATGATDSPPLPSASVVSAPADNEPPLLPPPPPPAPTSHPFIFHGDEREYFRIWIVNTLLTILTLGGFAAWAKVRKRRYLRGNTELMGHRFDYRANPWRLLVGNIIVVILFTAYGLFGQVYPMVRAIALVIAVVLLPWIVVRSLAFNAHNTTYRGLRFYYQQSYLGGAALYFGQFLLVILSCGILYPGWIRKQREFIIGNHRLGDAFFRFKAPVGPFYVSYLLAGILVGAAAVAGAVLTALAVQRHGGKLPDLVDLLPFFALYGLAIFVAKQLLFALLFNHVWSHTTLDDHRFNATLRTASWLKLQSVNLLAIIGTAGLLYPWAQVRSVRFALAHLEFQPSGPIEKIERLGRADGNALGETASEFFGMDFGL